MAITISGTTVTYNDNSTTTTNTPNATAALSAGVIGSYALLSFPSPAAIRPEGTQIAGSSLRYAPTPELGTVGNAPPGSWRLMGYLGTVSTPKGSTFATRSVWLRYA